jgi:DNA helicase-2/ATP-dependent DNA helicase PcrA
MPVLLSRSPSPSPQQAAAIEAFRAGRSFGLKARAGSGKTSTIHMMFAASPRPGLCLAFNKKNADELSLKIGPYGATAATLNSIGHRALLRAQGKVTLDTKKFYQILDNLKIEGSKEEIACLRQDYDLARNLGYVPRGTQGRSFVTADALDIDSPLELLDRVIRESIRLGFRGLVDYTDQIYLPACFNIPLPRWPLVVIDEAQDLSYTQHELVRRSLEPGGQIIVVGDPAQAIYAWRGASNSSYDDLIAAHNLEILPLTVSFRCPHSVVEYARRYVPDFEAAPSAPSGTVRTISYLDTVPAGSTYISRTNAPLIHMANTMLKRGQIPNYIGRDFTTGLRLILRKYPTRDAVERWYSAEISAVRSETKRQKLEDRFEALMALFTANSNPLTILEHLKENPGAFATLTTVHKAKGLEWPDVILNLSCRWKSEQDANIAYVGITRAQQTLQILEEDKPYAQA